MVQQSWTLSRGRTQIRRRFNQVGNVVHEASEDACFVHLKVLPCTSLDSNVDCVMVNDQESCQVRVVVGEHAEALVFRVSLPITCETHLVSNLHVQPYETVTVSTSVLLDDMLVNGVVTRNPISK